MEALERRDNVAYHRWMIRVLSATDIDPTPFFFPPKEEGQKHEDASDPETTDED